MARLRSGQFGVPNDWRRFVDYLNGTNRFVLTPYWTGFVEEIRRTAEMRSSILEKGVALVRARIGTRWMGEDDGDSCPAPLPPSDMGPPPKHLAKDCRISPSGIAYLYLATDIETAIAELRPWIGAGVTVGYFKTTKKLKVIDTTSDKPRLFPRIEFITSTRDGKLADVTVRPAGTYSRKEKESQIWGDISAAFSMPTPANSTPATYASTQYLAEVLKMAGFDGMAYKSSQNKKGRNIALFDPRGADCYACRMFDVSAICYSYAESGMPVWKSPDGGLVSQRVEILGPVDSKRSTGTDRRRRGKKAIGGAK